jgi:hypothetical protein
MALLVAVYETGLGAWNFTELPLAAGGGGKYNIVTFLLIGSGSV